MLDDLKYIHLRDLHDLLGKVERSAPTSLDISDWLPTKPVATNYAKQLALEVIGVSLVLTSGVELSNIAANWKEGFNQRARQLCWQEVLSEATIVTQLTAWTNQPTQKSYKIIELQTSFESEWSQKAQTASRRLLSGQRPEPIIVTAQGSTLAEQKQWLQTLGDFVTAYTALLNGLDPSAQPLLEKFNKLMDN